MMSPIRITPNKERDRLDPRSRINYCKLYTIEHNVKVYDFGMVHKDYLRKLKCQWMSVSGEQNDYQVEYDDPTPSHNGYYDISLSVSADTGDSYQDPQYQGSKYQYSEYGDSQYGNLQYEEAQVPWKNIKKGKDKQNKDEQGDQDEGGEELNKRKGSREKYKRSKPG
jgi:hypothetical protein